MKLKLIAIIDKQLSKLSPKIEQSKNRLAKLKNEQTELINARVALTNGAVVSGPQSSGGNVTGVSMPTTDINNNPRVERDKVFALLTSPFTTQQVADLVKKLYPASEDHQKYTLISAWKSQGKINSVPGQFQTYTKVDPNKI